MMTIGKSTFITKTRLEIKEKEERILHGLYKNEKWKELEHRLLRENNDIWKSPHGRHTKKYHKIICQTFSEPQTTSLNT